MNLNDELTFFSASFHGISVLFYVFSSDFLVWMWCPIQTRSWIFWLFGQIIRFCGTYHIIESLPWSAERFRIKIQGFCEIFWAGFSASWERIISSCHGSSRWLLSFKQCFRQLRFRLLVHKSTRYAIIEGRRRRYIRPIDFNEDVIQSLRCWKFPTFFAQRRLLLEIRALEIRYILIRTWVGQLIWLDESGLFAETILCFWWTKVGRIMLYLIMISDENRHYAVLNEIKIKNTFNE